MMQHLPSAERPRERCLTNGARCLSLRECLAVLIGSGPPGKGCLGVADDLISPFVSAGQQEFGFWKNLQLNPFPNQWLEQVHGLGAAGKARLLVSFELALRYQKYCEQAAPMEASMRTHPLGTLPHDWRVRTDEWIAFAPVYNNGTVTPWQLLATGTDSEVNFSPQNLLRSLLLIHASGFYLAHNHPNQDLSPSHEDIDMTERLQDMCDVLGVDFHEHFIVGRNQYLAIIAQDKSVP